jgi:hypothetical protein
MQRQNTSKDEITNCYSVSQSKWHLHVDAWFAALLVPSVESLAAAAIYCNAVTC